MIAIQNREHQGFDPTPRGEHMRRMRREKAIDNGGYLQTP
jgi:hypothetical protein